jgi:hypothetical protein
MYLAACSVVTLCASFLQNFTQYTEMVNGWAQGGQAFDSAVRRISELPQCGDLKLVVNSMNVFEFNHDESSAASTRSSSSCRRLNNEPQQRNKKRKAGRQRSGNHRLWCVTSCRSLHQRAAPCQ